MKKKMRLSQDKARRKRDAAAVREKQEMLEHREKRAWLTALPSRHPKENVATRDELIKMYSTVNRRMGHVVQMNEGLEFFSATQREKVFHALKQLALAVRTVAGVSISPISPRSAIESSSGRGNDMRDKDDASILHCKQAILECNDALAYLDKIIKDLQRMTKAEQSTRMQQISCKLVKEAEECSNAIEDHFGFVRIFAPIEALKLQNSLKRNLGLALLKKMGVDGLRVAEDELDVKLEAMFSEIDADGGGDIDFEGLSQESEASCLKGMHFPASPLLTFAFWQKCRMVLEIWESASQTGSSKSF